MEITRGKHRLKNKETKMNENNIYKGAWIDFIYIESDQTV
jgi:hypothetical protein